MKDNIERKCSQLGTESSNYIEETFGKKIEDVKVKCLIDCSFKEEFETKFQSLCNTWCDKYRQRICYVYGIVQKKYHA